ncbi:MAG: TIGR00730 family Rossman fold protein, partial [Deltaproteobacteria bacterium]|nr:TIGR00730 family Rossman fold protein [Deltaproteobacteria bacterium]
MASVKRKTSPYAHAQEEAEAAKKAVDIPQTRSDSYKLSYLDDQFILRDDLRPVRLQLELLKPELIQQEQGIESTVIFFGSARTLDNETALKELEKVEAEVKARPDDNELLIKLNKARRAVKNSHYYEEARKLARMISSSCQKSENRAYVITTGGGHGIMEAANRGAYESGAKSIGLNIVLPFEQHPNQYITPDLCFQFHYFAIRKMHFLMRAKALIVYPGGFGTMDELFETLTLVQTKKIKPIPILLFGLEYWKRLIDFEMFVEEGTISPEDLNLFRFVETAEEAWALLRQLDPEIKN